MLKTITHLMNHIPDEQTLYGKLALLYFPQPEHPDRSLQGPYEVSLQPSFQNPRVHGATTLHAYRGFLVGSVNQQQAGDRVSQITSIVQHVGIWPPKLYLTCAPIRAPEWAL